MALNLSSFRTSAFAITTAASLALSANFAALTGFSSPAHAAGSPACAKITDPAQNVICEIRESERRTREANQRGTEADRRGAEADRQMHREAALKVCLGQLSQYKTAQPTEFEKLLPITRDNACEKAAKLPRISAALD